MEKVMKTTKELNKDERDKLLLLILRVNLKRLQNQPVSEEEERDLVLAMDRLGLTLEEALDKAQTILK